MLLLEGFLLCKGKSKKDFIESILSFYKIDSICQVKDSISYTSKESMKFYESLNFFQKPWLSPRNGFTKFREGSLKYRFSDTDFDYISYIYEKYNFIY